MAAAAAQDLTPDALVRGISEDVLAAMRQDKALQGAAAFRLPAHEQTALGAHWRHASPEQQEALTREFRALLVRTYSGALAGYRPPTGRFTTCA